MIFVTGPAAPFVVALLASYTPDTYAKTDQPTVANNPMRFDLWLADACRTADDSYDDLTSTIAIGGYRACRALCPVLPADSTKPIGSH